MPSLVTIAISVDGSQVGSITVVNVHALSTIYPRLGIPVDVQLMEHRVAVGGIISSALKSQ